MDFAALAAMTFCLVVIFGTLGFALEWEDRRYFNALQKIEQGLKQDLKNITTGPTVQS